MMRRQLHALLAFTLAAGGDSFTSYSQYKLPITVSRSPSFSRLISLHESKQPDERSWTECMTSDPSRTAAFSGIMTLCGAALGPFLDSFHSAFGVLRYEAPLTAALWGTASEPALITAWWVPELFGLAGFIIGWLYIILDSLDDERPSPTPPLILVGISFFTFQYWLSGFLYSAGVDRTTILNVMSATAAAGFLALDRTMAGFLVSLATAVGGPLIEVGLLSILQGHGGYQYLDKGETGFFPLWIVPVYFLGGPAVGNLARGFWDLLSLGSSNEPNKSAATEQSPCPVCNDSRSVPCPNCDGKGYYVTYGKEVQCNCCKGRGLVICRECFDRYDQDPNDIEAIRDLMARMPD